jgi:hypothetical protein
MFEYCRILHLCRHAPHHDQRTKFLDPLHIPWALLYGPIRFALSIRHGGLGNFNGHYHARYDVWNKVCGGEASRGVSEDTMCYRKFMLLTKKDN